jgi:hypothetical protein
MAMPEVMSTATYVGARLRACLVSCAFSGAGLGFAIGNLRTVTYAPRPAKSILDGMEKLSRKGRPRWRDGDGLLYEWDPTHGGGVEVYDKNGYHRGVADPTTGEIIKPAVKGRKIDV